MRREIKICQKKYERKIKIFERKLSDLKEGSCNFLAFNLQHLRPEVCWNVASVSSEDESPLENKFEKNNERKAKIFGGTLGKQKKVLVIFLVSFFVSNLSTIICPLAY